MRVCHGSFFQPDAISCLPGTSVLISSPFMQYRAQAIRDAEVYSISHRAPHRVHREYM